jgi:hypothetical protein
MAAPIPCTARKAISVEALPANAQPSEATVNIAKPVMKIILAPSRSPSAPAVNMQAPNEIV